MTLCVITRAAQAGTKVCFVYEALIGKSEVFFLAEMRFFWPVAESATPFARGALSGQTAHGRSPVLRRPPRTKSSERAHPIATFASHARSCLDETPGA